MSPFESVVVDAGGRRTGSNSSWQIEEDILIKNFSTIVAIILTSFGIVLLLNCIAVFVLTESALIMSKWFSNMEGTQ